MTQGQGSKDSRSCGPKTMPGTRGPREPSPGPKPKTRGSSPRQRRNTRSSQTMRGGHVTWPKTPMVPFDPIRGKARAVTEPRVLNLRY